MTAQRDPDRLIRAFLEDSRVDLPDHVFDVVRNEIDHTRQRVVIGPWREEQMQRYAIFGLAAAAIVLVAVVGIQFLPRGGGFSGPPAATPTPTPTPTPTLAPTPTPTASPTAIADPHGQVGPGTYVAHPFPAPNRAMSFTFELSGSWDAHADPGSMVGINRDDVGFGFLQVSSLNGDPCKWSSDADDVAIGPTVDDLVSVLASETEYDTSPASEVNLSGYTGKKLVATMPDTLNPNASENVGCDEGQFRIWNATGAAIYAQGPENRWTMWILDVEGQRVVVMTNDYATSSAANREELQSIVDSIQIIP
jgi:hypothetical protein